MNLRPYQKKGKAEIFQAWKSGDRVVFFVLATGGGKTVTFTEVIKDFIYAGKRTMLIAHREELITQAWNTLYQNKIFAGIIKSGEPEDFSLTTQVCSIQTIARRKTLPHTDLIVIDEGHHVTQGNSYGKLIERFPEAVVLIVSATPYRLSGEGFINICKGVKTRLIVNSTLKTLTDEGWLVPLKYFVASIPDLSGIKVSKGDYDEEESKKAMELAPIVDSYNQHAKGKRGVVFCVNIAHSKSVVHQYNMSGIPAAHLDAESPKEYRKQILEDFRSGRLSIIANVGIITEGFDFPDLEFVQLARPTKSLSMYLQMVGRVTRAEKGLVDKFDEAEIRRKAIEASSKPHGIILDNAGCWQDHNLPDFDHNWESYFKGQSSKEKAKKADEMFEMLVYVVEDEKGNRITKFNVKEIEGLKLIEVTNKVREKIINLKSIKEFDKQYEVAKRIAHIKKPGYVAFGNYMNYCKKNNYLVVPEVWDYMERKLITDISDKLKQLEENRIKFPNSYPQQFYDKCVVELQAKGVSKHFLRKERIEYEQLNQQQIKQYLGNRALQTLSI